MSNNQVEQKPIKKGDGVTLFLGLVAVVLAILVALTILVVGIVGQFNRHKKMLAYHKDIPVQTQVGEQSGAIDAYDANIE